MSDSILFDIRVKADALDHPTGDELELLASVLPDLILLMQQQPEAAD